jgi:hypothetical protein
MKQRLLITTAIGLLIGTGAMAQSPNEKSNSPPAAQSQPNTNSSVSQPSSSANSPSSAQNAQSAPSNTRQGATTSQSTPNATAGNDNAARSQPQQNQSSQSSGSDSNSPNTPSQAKAPQQNSGSQAQTNTAPPVNNQNQPATNSVNQTTNNPPANQPTNNQAGTAQSPSNSQANTSQSASSNVSVSANLNDNQRTRVSESITRLNAKPVTNVNFSLSVGTVVPRDVQFQPLPADVVEILPQYRGYNFFVVREDIVIVEPSTYKIVDVLPRSGRSAAEAPASQPKAASAPSRKSSFSDSDREVIRKHARSSRTEERRTTGSATSTTRVRIGDRLPDSVEIRSFPDEVYRESPRLRDYRYIERDSRTYIIDPHERTILDEIE